MEVVTVIEMNTELYKRIETAAHNMRENMLEMTLHAGASGAHIGGALSSADIVAVLYCGIMDRPGKQDHFVLSKGHCALVQYAALCETGVISREELMTFEDNGGMFPAHPVMHDEIGIELSSGSLGLGLGFGIGLALADKKKETQAKTFVLLGNGECNEGSVWEAVMQAPKLGLDNLIAIMDNNHLQLDGEAEKIVPQAHIAESFRSFGWEVFEVNGHDIRAVYETLAGLAVDGRPKMIVADTVKGKGVSFMENQVKYHHAGLTQEQYNQAMEELKND